MPSRATVTLELEVDSDPIRGAIFGPGAPNVPFYGWIQLVSLLQAAAVTPPRADEQGRGYEG